MTSQSAKLIRNCQVSDKWNFGLVGVGKKYPRGRSDEEMWEYYFDITISLIYLQLSSIG